MTRVLTTGLAAALASVTLAVHPALAAKAGACNSSDGVVAEDSAEIVTEVAPSSEAGAESPLETPADAGKRADQTLKIDLSRDLSSLAGLGGRYTDGVPVLGLRIENRPGFKAATGCNALIPVLYKPLLELQADGTLLASVENKRFQQVLDPKAPFVWTQDADSTGQFFWIVPQRFGYDAKLKAYGPLTSTYATRYKGLAMGSEQRRWLAEAYLLAVMRVYRRNALNTGYPIDPRPDISALEVAFHTRLGFACSDKPDEMVCLAHTLIEENETARPATLIAKDAFRVGDAVYANSGVSTGIRQLDFGTGNAQANELVAQLLPTTVAKDAAYRKPIRLWNVTTMNRWYGGDGKRANDELSRSETKALLVKSHADYIVEAAGQWRTRLANAYPNWGPAERDALAIFAIDLENVTGKKLLLVKDAASACEVLTASAPGSAAATSGNLALVLNQSRRVRNGVLLVRRTPSLQAASLDCLAPGVGLPVTPPPVPPAPVPASNGPPPLPALAPAPAGPI